MKVIKASVWGKEIVCKCCKSTILIEPSDVYCYHWHNDDGYQTEYCANCVCGEYLKLDKLPEAIQNLAWKKKRDGAPRI